MGKATELDDPLSTRPLSAAEIRARQAAAESGGEVEADNEGQLIRRPKLAEAPKVVHTAPRQTWD
jgi:hypothetical protein